MKAKIKNFGLTERDIEVVLSMAKYRYLKASQIELLYFPSKRVTNRRLLILSEYKYLKRFNVRELLGRRIKEYAYCLDKKGIELCNIKKYKGNIAIKHKPENAIFLTHLLDLNDFRIALELACKKINIEVTKFKADYDVQWINGIATRETQESTADPYDAEKIINFAPDGTFILENTRGKQAFFFLEIDEGTEKIKSEKYRDFTDKLVAYASYYKNQGFKRHGKHFVGFRVLVVTKNEARITSYRQAGLKIGITKLVWFTTFEKLNKDTILKKIWKIADSNDNNFYAIL